MNVESIYRQYSQQLAQVYPVQEAKSLILILLSEGFGIGRGDLLMQREVSIDEVLLKAWVERLLKEEPIQHILGKAWFAGLELKVNQSTLIPRPETEGLVAWISESERGKDGAVILDVGTGSGCIPLGLKQRLPLSLVHGLDISPEALSVARENQEATGLDVCFHQCDILAEGLPIDKIDILVSNPPYIRPSEKPLMGENVLGHEPHTALFVPEDDPLLFYRRIAELGQLHLVEGGVLYFEINEAFGEDTLKLLHHYGYIATELRKDLQGKDRMVRAEKPRSNEWAAQQ